MLLQTLAYFNASKWHHMLLRCFPLVASFFEIWVTRAHYFRPKRMKYSGAFVPCVIVVPVPLFSCNKMQDLPFPAYRLFSHFHESVRSFLLKNFSLKIYNCDTIFRLQTMIRYTQIRTFNRCEE